MGSGRLRAGDVWKFATESKNSGRTGRSGRLGFTCTMAPRSKGKDGSADGVQVRADSQETFAEVRAAEGVGFERNGRRVGQGVSSIQGQQKGAKEVGGRGLSWSERAVKSATRGTKTDTGLQQTAAAKRV